MPELKYTIKHLPFDERPRERLLRHGAEAIATAELIAIILANGTKGKTVLQLAQEILGRFESLEAVSHASVEELCTIKGLGVVKAVQLKAALMLGLRASRTVKPPEYPILTPLHAYNALKEDLENLKKEHFVVLLLNAKSHLIRMEVVSIGTLTNTLVHPREVFSPAVRHNAASIIIAHNHPSGDSTPSKQDIELTRQLVSAGKMMGIAVNDHLIVGKGNYISLREKGIIF
jgi:DNA repair protein RadC